MRPGRVESRDGDILRHPDAARPEMSGQLGGKHIAEGYKRRHAASQISRELRIKFPVSDAFQNRQRLQSGVTHGAGVSFIFGFRAEQEFRGQRQDFPVSVRLDQMPGDLLGSRSVIHVDFASVNHGRHVEILMTQLFQHNGGEDHRIDTG